MKIIPFLSSIVNRAPATPAAPPKSATMPAAASAPRPTGRTSAESFSDVQGGGILPMPIASKTIAPTFPALGAFADRFTQEPYFFGRAFNGKIWLVERPRVPLALAESIAKACPVTPEQSKTLLELWLLWQGTNQTLQKCSFMGQGIAFQEQMMEWQGKRERGEQVDDREILSREQFAQRSDTLRQLARAEQKRISRQVYPVMKDICTRRAEFCREQVTKLDKQEREAVEPGFEYRPSEKIRALVFLALVGAFVNIENYFESMPFLPPENDWWGTELFPVPKDEKAIAAAAKKIESEKAHADWGKQEESRRREQAEAETKQSHGEQLAEINAFNDSMRDGFAAFRKERIAQRKAAADE